MGGLFGKQPNESEGTASQKKASGNKSDEEDLTSSSESDLELGKKEEDANKCKSCNTCGGSNTEKQKKKEAKEAAKHLKIWDKKTATSRMPLKRVKDGDIKAQSSEGETYYNFNS